MKECLNCGEAAENDLRECPKCGRSFAYYKPVGDQSGVSMTTGPGSSEQGTGKPLTASEEHERTRPDGSIPRTIGWILIAASVLLGLWSVAMPVNQSFSTEIDPDKVATKAFLAIIAEGSFGFGLILWLAGYIVHAISFLPGKEDVIAHD